jgi:hypothetical protein
MSHAPGEIMTHSSEVTAAADLAVKKVFFMLGVDVDNAASVESFREDLRFGRRLRKLANSGVAGIVGLLALGLVTALYSGILNSLKGG